MSNREFEGLGGYNSPPRSRIGVAELKEDGKEMGNTLSERRVD